MSEQNNTEMTFQIQRIYTKDISFEAPNAPHVFQKDWQPEVKLDLDTASTQLADDVYEVVLRVTVTASLLREGDFDAFLQMVTASGDSSWEYLQNVIPAGYKEHQEVAVTIAAAKHYLGGKGAVRVHGGGFAGTVQAFVPVEMLTDFKANMEKILGAGRCHVLNIRPEGGAVL